MDATRGVLPQTRRHAFIASLLGIPRLVVAVNKMDLVDYAESTFDAITADFREFAARLGPLDLRLVPVASRDGVNLVTRDTALDALVSGESVLEILESVYVGGDRNLVDLRLPVQFVMRGPDGSRSLAGQVVSGVVREGDELMVLPSRATARVRALTASRGKHGLPAVGGHAHARPRDRRGPRGSAGAPGQRPHRPHLDRRDGRVARRDAAGGRPPLPAEARHADGAGARREAGLRRRREHAQPQRRAHVGPARDRPRLTLTASQPLFVDAYARNKATGSFILIDPGTQATVAAGMVVDRGTPARPVQAAAERHVRREASAIPAADRTRRMGQRSITVWLTGLSGSGKSTIARELERTLHAQGRHAFVLDGDTMRSGLNRPRLQPRGPRRERAPHRGSGAGAERRRPHRHRRPHLAVPGRARARAGNRRCRALRRGPRGHPARGVRGARREGPLRRARSREVAEFTGISSPYEAPLEPALVLQAGSETAAESAARLLASIVGGESRSVDVCSP